VMTSDRLAWHTLTPDSWNLTPLPLVGRRTCIAADEGGVWIGGTTGLAWVDARSGAARVLTIPWDVPAAVRDVVVDRTFLWGAAALSDRAAEGAKPLGVLVSLGLPGHEKRDTGNVDEAAEIMAGIAAVAKSVGAKVLGGDLIKADKYLVDVCVLGTAPQPVRRAGARPGDVLWVTGTLGGARLALQRLQTHRPLEGPLRGRFAHPEPRVAAGQWLAAQGATALIDLSDGLSGDAGHLAAASRVGVEIALERVPCWPGVDPLSAVASGEEYELLVAMPAA